MEIIENEVLCFDFTSCRYFKSSIDNLKRAINSLNQRRIDNPKHRTRLNEWYEVLDAPYTPPIDTGDMVGWESYKK